jgi:O-antigen/teichoic acid export membrane protein
LNGINGVVTTCRALGGVAVLWWVSPTIEAFFAWQGMITGVNLIWARLCVHRLIPDRSTGERFEFAEIRRLSSFAMGMGGINMLGLILTQLDKLILSWLLPLQQFGYYVLAWTLGTVIYRLAGPVFSAVQPRMTQLTSAGSSETWGSFLQKSGQVMAVLIVPFSLFMATFAEEIVLLWTHDLAIARADRWVLALLAFGTMFNGIVQIPYSLHIAQGRIRPIFVMSLLVVLFAAPMVYFLTLTLGPVGAASVWTIANLVFLVTIAALTWPLIGRAALAAWLWHSMAKPVAFSLLLLAGLKAVLADGEMVPRVVLLLHLAAAGIICQFFVIALVPFSRERALGALRQVRRLLSGGRPVDNGG